MASDTHAGKGLELLNRTALPLTLEALNPRWRDVVNESLVLKPFLAIGAAFDKLESEPLARLGTILQKLSFLLSVLLFVLVGMHQFVEDKFKLAILVIVSLALWIIGYLLHGKEKRPVDAFDAIVLAYLAANIVAACASHYFAASLKGLAKVIIYIAGYFLFTANLNRSLKRKLIVVSIAILTGVALSIYGLYQYKIGVAPLATWEDPTIESSGTRIFATLDNPNLLAGFLVSLVPLSLGLSLGCLEKRKFVFSIVLLLVTALITLATLLTGSRGGMLGLIGGIFPILYIGSCWLWKNYREKRSILIAVVSAFVIAAVAFFLSSPILAAKKIPIISETAQRFDSIFAGHEHSSNAYRMNVYSASLKMFKDSWWIGTGPGNETFRLAYGLYMVSSYDALGTYNVPLEVAVETGLPGLLAFGFLLICPLSRSHIRFWSSIDGTHPALSSGVFSRWLAAGGAAAIIALMVHGLGDTVFYRPQVHFLFWLIIAVLVVEDTERQPERELSVNPG